MDIIFQNNFNYSRSVLRICPLQFQADCFGQIFMQRGSIRNIIYAYFRFGNFGFGSVNLTEISVSVVSVFTRFGRPLKVGTKKDMEIE